MNRDTFAFQLGSLEIASIFHRCDYTKKKTTFVHRNQWKVRICVFFVSLQNESQFNLVGLPNKHRIFLRQSFTVSFLASWFTKMRKFELLLFCVEQIFLCSSFQPLWKRIWKYRSGMPLSESDASYRICINQWFQRPQFGIYVDLWNWPNWSKSIYQAGWMFMAHLLLVLPFG